jgi:hypothetical protein
LGVGDAWQEPRPVPLTSAVRVIRRGDERLRGVSAVDVVVDLSAASASCGLSRPRLQDDVRTRLVGRGLRASISEKASSWFYTVSLALDTLVVHDRCVTSVRVQLSTPVDAIPEIDRYATSGQWGSLLVGQLPLIESSKLIESPADEHPRRVRMLLDEQLDALAGRVAAANP